ncbi:MAG: hypothetical protein MJ220_03885 [Bacilli bacterium]|nr:hypothetical protein [Bacilli bacterium]
MKKNYPAKSVFLAGIICGCIGLVAFAVSAAMLLVSATGVNLVGTAFSTIFGVIGGVFSMNPAALSGNAMTIAAIGVAFVGFLVGIFFIVDFARIKNGKATIASTIGTIAFLLICLVLECYVVSRTNGGARIRALGGMGITAAPLALSLLACLIYQIVSYVEKTSDEKAAIEAAEAPVEEPAAETESSDDTGYYTDEELRALVQEEIAKAIEAHKNEPVEESMTEDKVKAIVKDEIGDEPKDSVTEEKVREIVKEELQNYQPAVEDDEEEEEETPAIVVAAETPEAAKAPRKRRAKFETKLKKADKDLRHKYYDLRDYIKSYGINNRISIPGDTFSLHRERYAFITIVGSRIKVYLPLNVQDYANSPIPVEAANAKKYEDLPMVFKVKSDLSFRRAKKLIDDVMAAKGIQKPAEPEAK